MTLNMFWKSVWRRKGSLFLCLLLIGTAAFGFTFRAVEYLTVTGEIDRLSQSYKTIGMLRAEEGEVTAGIPLIEASPYVDFTDKQRYCPGILQGIYNGDTDGLSGDYEGKPYASYGVRISDILVWAKLFSVSEKDEAGHARGLFQIEEPVYGYPDYTEPETVITVDVKPEALETGTLTAGKTYLIKGTFVPYEDIFQLKPLEEGLWFLEGEAGNPAAMRYVDEDAKLQERNRHAMAVVATADMSAMPAVQEVSRDFYLEEGRWLSREDDLNGQKVCVIHKHFAKVRNLKIGDTLRLELENWTSPYLGYVTDGDTKAWKTCEKTTVELEIVGIYGRLYGAGRNELQADLSSRSNYMYVPDSCLPKGYGEQDTYYDYEDSFSFVLNSSKDKEQFIKETEQELAALGLSLAFVENNWDNFYRSAKAIEQGAFYSFLIFAAVMAAALGAVVFLYCWQRKREIAIVRAMGVRAGRAGILSVIPILFWGAIGILAGGIGAWAYGQKQVADTLTALEAESTVEMPGYWLVGSCLLIWAVLCLFLLAGVLFSVRKTVLMILQGNGFGGRRKRKAVSLPEPGKKRASVSQSEASVQLTDKKEPLTAVTGCASAEHRETAEKKRLRNKNRGAVVTAMTRFIRRCLFRFSFRTLFILLAAMAFVSASGWLWQSIRDSDRELERLYRTTIVEAEIAKANTTVVVGNGGGFIYGKTIEKILDTGFVESCYLEAASEGTIEKGIGAEYTKDAGFLGIADMEQFLNNTKNQIRVQYAAGYNGSRFAEDYSEVGELGALTNTPVFLVPEALWQEWELKPGDIIGIFTEQWATFGEAAGYYSGGLNGSVLMPLSFLERMEGDNPVYVTAKFTLNPEKNRELSKFREETAEIFSDSGAGLLEMSFLIWDGELRRAVEPMEKNIALMKLLYPLTNLVSLLLAAGLGILFLFQRRREAALLRVLGVGKGGVRIALALELFLVNLVGILLGLGAAMVLTETGSGPFMGIGAGCYLLGCMAGIGAGVILITRGQAIASLQVKE